MKRLLISLASSAALIFLLIGPALHSQITVSPAGGGSGGSGTPGGATTQLQYNNAGAFAGIAGLTWDGTTLTAGAIPINLGAANPLTLPPFTSYSSFPCEFCVAASDETTAITTGTGKVTFRAPYAFTLTAVRASVNTAPTGSTILIDINESGTTVLSTKLMIDATEKTSTTATTAYVISDAAIADDAEISIDFDQVGSTIAGAGVKVWIIGHR